MGRGAGRDREVEDAAAGAERRRAAGTAGGAGKRIGVGAAARNARGERTERDETAPKAALAWLDRDLAAHPKGKGGVTTLVVAMHIPPETDGIKPHGTRFGYKERTAKLLAILKRHGVDAVLSGHEHMQHVEDWEGVLLLVSGGAGAPLAPFQRYGYYRIDVGNGKVRETFQRVRPADKAR